MKKIQQESESNCNYNKNNNFKRKKIIPYVIEHSEVCKDNKDSPEKIKEMEELLKEFKTKKEC